MSHHTDFRLKRAAWVAECLDTFVTLTSCDPGEDAVSDLISDLGHYCDRHDLDFPMLLRRAIGHWLAEQDDPDSLTCPDVAIHADGVELTSRPE